ncbi:MAG: ImmA/IrrE family metallo-endopeptidase [Proteobacteria bacterium]|nr:ImmA/IrrE family metallo-endopeptidase [Pseudomonadota bacterium]
MAEANKISQLLRVLPDDERFPVDVEKVALELSRVRYSDDPIVSINTFDIDGVEGLLGRHPTDRKWKIGYNHRIQSPGRIRFTLAHEFGHYILHREMKSEFRCSLRDMHEWDQRDIEAEADVFASYLLMPLDDYRNQVAGLLPSIEMLRHCGNRYGVSLMAAALKWTEIATKRAVVVAARDGFVLWARSNNAAFRSRVYLPAKKLTIPVPEESILNQVSVRSGPVTAKQRANLWFEKEPGDIELVEHALAIGGDYPYTLGLLLLPDATPLWELPEDDLLIPVDQALRWRK